MRDFSYDSAQYEHFNDEDEDYIKKEFYHKTRSSCDYLEFYPIGDGRYYAFSITDDYSGSYTDVWIVGPETDNDKEKRETRQAKQAEINKVARAKKLAKAKEDKEAVLKNHIKELEKAGYKITK